MIFKNHLGVSFLSLMVLINSCHAMQGDSQEEEVQGKQSKQVHRSPNPESMYKKLQRAVDDQIELDNVDQIKLDKKFMNACEKGNLELVKTLCKQDRQLHITNTAGLTPLHLASKAKKIDIVEFLVDQGAELEAQDNCGQAPLHTASNEGALEIVKYLLGKGAKIDALDKYVHIPLHFACRGGYVDIVELMLEAGANPGAKNKIGMTPLYMACEEGQKDVVIFILTYIQNLSNMTLEKKLEYLCRDNVFKKEVETFLLINKYRVKKNLQIPKYLKLDFCFMIWRRAHLTDFRWRILFDDLIELLGELVNSPVKGSGKTPIMIARENKHDALVELLKAYEWA